MGNPYTTVQGVDAKTVILWDKELHHSTPRAALSVPELLLPWVFGSLPQLIPYLLHTGSPPPIRSQRSLECPDIRMRFCNQAVCRTLRTLLLLGWTSFSESAPSCRSNSVDLGSSLASIPCG